MADKGLTQKELSKLAGYKAQGTVGNWLARGSLPKRLNAVAAVLGVRPEWIETGALPREASAAPAHQAAPAQVAPSLLSAAHAELLGYFDELPPYQQALMLKDARSRAARELGDRILAEKFGVTGYAGDDSLPDIYKQFERRRERRGIQPQAVPVPFKLRPDESDDDDRIEEGRS